MRILVLTALLSVSVSSTVEATTLTPVQEQFARDMISCGQKYVALSLAQRSPSPPMQIISEGKLYSKAARDLAGDTFVDQETPKIRQESLAFISANTNEGKDQKALAKLLKDTKKQCDNMLSNNSASKS